MYFSPDTTTNIPVGKLHSRFRLPKKSVNQQHQSKYPCYKLTFTRGFQRTNTSKKPHADLDDDRYPTTTVNISEMSPTPRIQSKVKKVLSSHSDNSFQPDVSIPGLGIICSETRWMRKLVWGLAVTFCVSFCFIQIRRQLLEFWNVPVTVDVKLIREEILLFPIITICPIQPFQRNKVLQDRLRVLNRTYSNNTLTNLKHPFFNLLQLPNENVTNLWQYGRVKEGDFKTQLVCKNFTTAMNCHLQVTRKEIITFFGICSSYTLSDLVKYDGPYNGFHLFYYLHGNEGRHQYTLIFHHPDDDPSHFLYKDSGTYVNSFVRTHIVYTKQEFRNVNIPRRPCLPRKEFSKCYSRCVENAINENATCCWLPYMTTATLKPCTTPESADHTYNVSQKVYEDMDNLCRHCPRKCEEEMYRFTESTLSEHNFTLLTIHMVDNVVQVVQELAPYTFDKLLSDVGGMLGLFMGVCILTGLQVLDAFFEWIKQKMPNWFCR